MWAEIATTSAALPQKFVIDFDKKPLREQSLTASLDFESLRHSLMHPLMNKQLKPLWRSKLNTVITLMVNKTADPAFLVAVTSLLSSIEDYASFAGSKRPLVSIELLKHMAGILGETFNEGDSIEGWVSWVNGIECMKLAPEYRALLAVYYLQIIHPCGARQVCINIALLTYLLRCAGFDDLAEGIAYHFCADEYQLTKIFITTQKSQHLQFFQTQWIMHYLAIFQQFLSESKILMQEKYDQALFDQARYGADINERQVAIIDQLVLRPKLRDKKTLAQSSFYRALYIKQSRRTMERDFKNLCDQKLIIMRDPHNFKLAIDKV